MWYEKKYIATWVSSAANSPKRDLLPSSSH